MVKPKDAVDIKLEDYFYVDDKGILRWKQKYSKMNKGDRAGKKYSSFREEVCFKGHYYPVEFIKTLLLSSCSNAPPTDNIKRPADSTPKRLLTLWADPETTYMTPTADLRGLKPADTRQGRPGACYPRSSNNKVVK